MVTELAKWYTKARMKGPEPDKLSKRATDIETAVKKKSDFIQDCIRIYLKKKPSAPDFKEQLTEVFAVSDPYFSQGTKIDLELQILAGAIIYQFAKTSKSKDKFQLLQSLRTGSFGITSDIINPDIIEFAIKSINEEAITVRENIKAEPIKFTYERITVTDWTNTSDKLNALNDIMKTVVGQLNNSVSKRLLMLDEESNIHWWLYRGISLEAGDEFTNVDNKIIPVHVAYELMSLTKLFPSPFPSDQYILKMLKDADKLDKAVAIKDVVNSIEESDLRKLVPSLSSYGNLLPISSAIEKRIGSQDKTTWLTLFDTETGIKSTSKFSVQDLAFQLYNELILLKSF